MPERDLTNVAKSLPAGLTAGNASFFSKPQSKWYMKCGAFMDMSVLITYKEILSWNSKCQCPAGLQPLLNLSKVVE